MRSPRIMLYIYYNNRLSQDFLKLNTCFNILAPNCRGKGRLPAPFDPSPGLHPSARRQSFGLCFSENVVIYSCFAGIHVRSFALTLTRRPCHAAAPRGVVRVLTLNSVIFLIPKVNRFAFERRRERARTRADARGGDGNVIFNNHLPSTWPSRYPARQEDRAP